MSYSIVPKSCGQFPPNHLGVLVLTGLTLAIAGTAGANGPPSIQLGTAGNYAILAKTGLSTVPPSMIRGDIGASPVAATYLTGFSLVADATRVFWTSSQIVGKAFAADNFVPTPNKLIIAVLDMETAYTDGAGRPSWAPVLTSKALCSARPMSPC